MFTYVNLYSTSSKRYKHIPLFNKQSGISLLQMSCMLVQRYFHGGISRDGSFCLNLKLMHIFVFLLRHAIAFNLNNHTTNSLLCTYKALLLFIVHLIILLIFPNILQLLRLVKTLIFMHQTKITVLNFTSHS